LSRTTPDSATAWTYSRSVSGSASTTTVTDPLTDQTVINFEKDGSTSNPNSNFFETQRVVKQGSSTTLSTTITCYNGNNVGTPSSCYNTAVSSPIARTTVFHYLPTSAGSQSKTDTTYNSNGLVSEVDEYDYGSGAVGLLLRKTLTTYGTYSGGTCLNLGNSIVDRPCTVTIQDSGGTTKALTTYTYDEGTPATSGATQHVSITGSRGNLTTVAAQANGTTTLYRKFTYYDTGILQTSSDVSTTNAATNTTTYNYSTTGASCDFAFPTSISEPLSLSRSMTWDCNGAVLKSLTDENSKVTSTAYSGSNYTNKFWRPYSTTDQAGNITYFTYPSANQTETALTFNSSVVDHLTTVDGLGRPSISQTKQGPSSGNYDSVETAYDANGRVSKTTMPYVAASGVACSGTCPGTSYGYDSLNRVTSVTDGGNGYTDSVYTNNDVLQTVGPTPTRQKQLEYDGLGRLSSVCELTTTLTGNGNCAQKNNQTGYWTTYTYDVLGNLKGVTQSAQNAPRQTRTYGYDMLGRLASEANPETGTTTYYWDAAASSCGGGAYATPGDLGAKKDNAGVYTCYGYDALHRLAGFGPSNSTNCTGFQYDSYTPPTGVTVLNPLGRLVEAYTNSACDGHGSLVTDKWFSYSARGEVTDIYTKTPNSGGFYHMTKSYWPHGALKTLGGIPGVPTIYYGASDGSGLDGEGRVTKVTASSGTNPVTAVTYGGTGQPVDSLTQVTYGSSDFDNFSYDTGTGRMKGYQFNIGTLGRAVVGTLGWNQNGTLGTLGIVDPFNGANTQTCTYTHDDLGRVSSVSCGNSTWTQNFSYDAFGNISKSVPTGGTGISFHATYVHTDGSNNNQIWSLPGFTPTYDADGNLKQDSFHTYQWDANGHMIANDSTTLTYDAMGNMAEASWGDQYLYDTDGRLLAGSAAQASAYYTAIPLPGGGIVSYNSGSLGSYKHGDWLGSVRLASTPTQTVAWDVAAAPFGETYASTHVGNVFAGMQQNIVGDEYDTHFREYHTSQGRWISPDPAGLAAVDPSNPQTWNRYAYVNNDPLSATDPSGLLAIQSCLFDNTCDSGPSDMCDVWDSFCFVFGDPWDNGGPGGPGGGGGFRGGGPRGGDHGRWPGNETTGLPQLPTQPLSLGDLLGLTPSSGFISDAGTLDSPFTIRVLVLESAGPLIECAVTPVCQEVLLAGAIGVGLVATIHYFGRPQSNEWTDMAKQAAPQDVCGWLAAQRQLPQNQDSATQRKIVQAQKFLGCRNISKRNQ
jgi:RHS repeat-associated protein